MSLLPIRPLTDALMSEGSEFDQVSNWSGATPRSETSVDTIQDLMRRFTLDYRPDYTLKIRSR